MHEDQPKKPASAEGGGLKFPEWQVPLQDLILEYDRARLRDKMQRVEALISDRIQQLHNRIDGHAEREALTDALAALRVFQREKLNFPDWK
jgi:hypothetical protein